MSDLPEISNYKIIRKIGEGGYGKVYLAKLKDSFPYVALKVIMSDSAAREQKALEKYLEIPAQGNMVEIIDYGATENFLYYSSALADPIDASFSPEDFRWQPKSLQNLIENKLDSPDSGWFSAGEILEIMSPIFDAAITLGENGLLHRDIKPDNILFFNGKAKLSDFGLIEKDTHSLSNMGTPLYIAPSWYVSRGGNPDAYGLAATFYALISGNLPDTLGRPAYRFPEKSIAENEKERWLHWHRCILRAVSESSGDRYVTLQDFKKAVFSEDFESSKIYNPPAGRKFFSRKRFYIPAALAAVFAILLFAKFFGGISPSGLSSSGGSMGPDSSTYEIPDEIYLKIKSDGFHSGEFFIDDIESWKQAKLSVLLVLRENYAKSKALSEMTREQVVSMVDEDLLRRKESEPDLPIYGDKERFEAFRASEVEMVLFSWKLARDGLADELETLNEFEDALKNDSQYRKYVSETYKKYLEGLK